MKNRSFLIRFLVCVFPFVTASLIYIFRNNFISLGTILPACPSYTFFDIYCPGCGNTRSVQHLLAGDVAGSLRFNPSVIFGLFIGILAYAELISLVLGRHIKLVPRARKFWIIIIIAFSVYFIVRNFVRLF